MLITIIGFLAGIIGGMGMGGGTLLIPILTIFLSLSQKSAQAINLLVFIPMSLVAIIIHFKNKLVDFKVGIPIMLVGVCFSILGSILANTISNYILKKIFGGFLLVVGVYQGIQTIFAIIKNKKQNKIEPQFKIYIK